MGQRLSLAAFAGSLLLLGTFLTWLWLDSRASSVPNEPIVVQSGAGMRAPVEAIIAEYERETGKKVEARYGGSQTVLTNLQVTKQGDLFLPGDSSYIDLAREKDLMAEVLPLAKMQVVLLVNPKFKNDITSWRELVDSEIRLAQTEPRAAAIGKLTKEVLVGKGLWQALDKRTVVYTGNVTEVANAVKLGSVDAGLVWDAITINYPNMRTVHLPELDEVTAEVQVAVVKTSPRATEALRFARYLAAGDKGLPLFQKHGFALTAEGDEYAATPELVVYGGSMLRLAIDGLISDFEKREGVRVTRVYNGCGILVGQMKTGARPDLYFACDTQFMELVSDLFEKPAVVSSNQLVIAVPKGNPHGLKELRDLSKPNLRVGVGHEKQCAMGQITKETFIRAGVLAGVSKNVVVQSPTGDFLINQLRTGSLDAVVAYRSNAEPYDDIEAVPVEGIPCAFPDQPVAVSKSSKHRRLTYRLIDALTTPEAQERFELLGFGWKWAKK